MFGYIEDTFLRVSKCRRQAICPYSFTCCCHFIRQQCNSLFMELVDGRSCWYISASWHILVLHSSAENFIEISGIMESPMRAVCWCAKAWLHLWKQMIKQGNGYTPTVILWWSISWDIALVNLTVTPEQRWLYADICTNLFHGTKPLGVIGVNGSYKIISFTVSMIYLASAWRLQVKGHTYIVEAITGDHQSTQEVSGSDSQMKCPSICESEVHCPCPSSQMFSMQATIDWYRERKTWRASIHCTHWVWQRSFSLWTLDDGWVSAIAVSRALCHLGWAEKTDWPFQSHPSCYGHWWFAGTWLQQDWDNVKYNGDTKQVDTAL